ncbi:MAG: hypothetical protein HC900_10770 [Methylacidiphilales bacterium]|nr:hypothetical protein [Candidatus Methylacidiphilales bacterium]
MLGLGLSFSARPRGGQWSPAALFTGADGAWYDIDPAYMFIDRSGTGAPAAVGQPVGTIVDRSGNANHAVAPSDAARGILRQSGGLYYIELDGVDDCYGIDGTMIVGVNYFNVVGFSKRTTVANGEWAIIGGTTGAANQRYELKWRLVGGDLKFYAGQYANDIPGVLAWSAAPIVISHRLNNAGRILRANGAQIGSTSNTTKLLAWSPAYIGRSGYYIDANFYGAVFLGREPTANELTRTEKWFADRAGVTLP